MKLSAALKLLAGLLLGLIAGVKIAPVNHAAALSSSRNHVENSGAEEDAASAQPATGPDLQKLAGILGEENAYLAAKDLSAYLNQLRPDDFPKVLDGFRSGSESNREWVVDMLIHRWMEVDPGGVGGAVVQARTMADKDFAARVVSDVYGDWAARDPQAALADARDMLYGDERRTALKAVVEKIAGTDPARAWQIVKSADGSHLTDYASAIFSQWARSDLAAATQALAQLPHEGNQIAPAAIGIVTALLEKDPRSAAAWINELPPGETRSWAMENLGGPWAKIDPQAAVTWAKSLTGDGASGTMQEVCYQWSVQDPRTALAYAQSLSASDDWRGSIFFWAVGQWAIDDADAAGNWVINLPASQEKDDAAGQLISNWSEYDPVAAAAFVPRLPDGPDRQGAIGPVAEAWAASDPDQTEQWVMQQPPGNGRDDAVKTVSNALAGSNPAHAVQLAGSIGDAHARDAQLQTLFQQWINTAPAEGKAALQNSELPLAVKNQLLGISP
jgi:hypothetical protein